MEIAPASVRPALAAAALDERLSEVEQLAAVGRWSLVTVAADEARDAETTLVALGGAPSGESAGRLARHRGLLARLLAVAPASARSGIAVALAASDPPLADGHGNDGLGGNGGGNGNNPAQDHQGNGIGGGLGNGGAGSSAGNGQGSGTSEPTASPSGGQGQHSEDPRATRSPRPSGSPNARQSDASH